MDAKNALDHLNGFHLQERYIVVLYHMPAKQDAAAAKADLARREEELVQLKKKHNIGDDWSSIFFAQFTFHKKQAEADKIIIQTPEYVRRPLSDEEFLSRSMSVYF